MPADTKNKKKSKRKSKSASAGESKNKKQKKEQQTKTIVKKEKKEESDSAATSSSSASDAVKQKSPYIHLNGQSYSRSLVAIADNAIRKSIDGTLNKSAVEAMVAEATEGNRLTQVAQRTLKYIKQIYIFFGDNEALLDEKIDEFKQSKAKPKKEPKEKKKPVVQAFVATPEMLEKEEQNVEVLRRLLGDARKRLSKLKKAWAKQNPEQPADVKPVEEKKAEKAEKAAKASSEEKKAKHKKRKKSKKSKKQKSKQ